MKKIIEKNKFYIFIIIFSFVLIIFSIFKILNLNKPLDKDLLRQFKSYSVEIDDGWFYYITNDKIEIKDDEFKYITFINGCNLKYETIDDNYIPVINQTTKEIESKIPSTPPTLVTSYRTRDKNKTENDELHDLNLFFNNIDINKKLSFEDINNIEFVNFDKNTIISLWNNVQSMKYNDKFGEYTALGQCFYRKENKTDNYFQVGVLASSGYLEKVRIDYYSNGKYLSDLVKNNEVTEEEKDMYEKLKKIEDMVIKNGTFKVINENDELFSFNNSDELLKIFKKIESEKRK